MDPINPIFPDLATADPDPAVRAAADAAVAHLTPDGGRGGEVVRRHGGVGERMLAARLRHRRSQP